MLRGLRETRDGSRAVLPDVAVTCNAVSREMVTLAETALRRRDRSRATTIDIAYLSGTPTHSRDFAEVAQALAWTLEQYPQTRFVAVGHLRLDERFDRFGERVERVPLQPWRALPTLLARIDINLAPLESNNPFTDAKSCLKYIEAGLVGVPTIASPRPDFVRAITHGENGLLADSEEEWKAALQQLVESADTRLKLGVRALVDVGERHTTTARAPHLHGTLARLGRSADDDPLRLNWILRAPIPRSGGYRTIFRLASFLAERGHPTRVYVEPIAHLEGLSRRRIEAFLEEHFGTLPFEVRVGHDAIAPV